MKTAQPAIDPALTPTPAAPAMPLPRPGEALQDFVLRCVGAAHRVWRDHHRMPQPAEGDVLAESEARLDMAGRTIYGPSPRIARPDLFATVANDDVPF